MKKPFLLFFSLCITLMLQATTPTTISVVSTAGGLSTAITKAGGNLSTITNLTVTGTIDARDFSTMSSNYNMPILSVLDLSKAIIAAYTSPNNYTTHSNTIPDAAFFDCNNLTSITIPSSVTAIGNSAFWNCHYLTSVNIPSSVVISIGNWAFYNCNALTSITIPSSINVIGDNAFYNCNALTSITIPSSITVIGKNTFYQCYSLASIKIPTSVDSIGVGAFLGCNSLTSVNIPSLVTAIGNDAFYGCTGLTSITIPSSVKSIGVGAFYYNSFSSVNIPSSVTSIGECAFAAFGSITVDANNPNYSSIDGVLFNKNKTTLIQYPEFSLKTENYVIPSSVTSIGEAAFRGCQILTSIAIPTSVTFIGDSVFDECRGLTSIYAYPTTPVDLSSSANVFDGINISTCVLFVPAKSVALYKAAYQWSSFRNIFPMTTTGISTEDVNSIILYPNPATEGFYIKGLEGIGTLSILDLNAKTLLTKQVSGNEYVSISSFPKGLYIIKISTQNGMIDRKIMKN